MDSPPKLPELPPQLDALIARRRNTLAVRVAVASANGWTDERLAAVVGVSVREIQVMIGRANELVSPIGSGAYRERCCEECGEPLPVDARSDARWHLRPSTCRVKALQHRQRAEQRELAAFWTLWKRAEPIIAAFMEEHPPLRQRDERGRFV